MYAWIIDVDHLFDPKEYDPLNGVENEVGTMGPRNATRDDIRRLMEGEGEQFRMYDDDGILYYSGRLVVSGDTTRDSEEAMFAPLDDFGRPNAGAVDIKWEWDEWRSA